MFDALIDRIRRTETGLTIDTVDAKEEVAACLVDTRRELTQQRGELGPWEAQELDLAESVRVGAPSLALLYAKHALEVSQLPLADYKIGFGYAKPKRCGRA